MNLLVIPELRPPKVSLHVLKVVLLIFNILFSLVYEIPLVGDFALYPRAPGFFTFDEPFEVHQQASLCGLDLVNLISKIQNIFLGLDDFPFLVLQPVNLEILRKKIGTVLFNLLGSLKS